MGWALSAINDRHLTLKALEMALQWRCPGAGLLHHSDQGATYASEDYRRMLAQHGIICSMSRRPPPLADGGRRMAPWVWLQTSDTAREG